MTTIKIDALSRKELDDLINNRIRHTVSLAYEHVPYWHKKFESLDMKPSDIKNCSDLLDAYKKGLEISRNDLINCSGDLSPDYASDIFSEELWTGGTSGIPKAVHYTSFDYEKVAEQACSAFEAMHLKPGNRLLSLMAPQPFSSGMMVREGARKYGLGYLQATPVPTHFLLQTIKRYRPSSIIALPTKAYSLPLEFEAMGADAKRFGIKSIGIGGEATTPERRDKISKSWNAEVIDVWASSEGSIMSFNCDKYCGMHVNESRSFITFVDPETKEEVSGKENGIDLITNLYDISEKPANLLINYSHGDLSRVISSERCECGRTTKRIAHPFRIDDVVSMRGVKLYVRDVEAYLAKLSNYFTGEYVGVYRFDDSSIAPTLEVRLEIQKELPENVFSNLKDDVFRELLSSNPAALSVMSPQDIKVIGVSRGKLYDNLNVKPGGKPTRLIRTQP